MGDILGNLRKILAEEGLKLGSFPFQVGDVITPSLSGGIGSSRFIYHKGRGYTVKALEEDFGDYTVTLFDPISGRTDKIRSFPHIIFSKEGP